MRSIIPRRSAAPLSALFAFLLVCTPAAAQTAPPPAASDAAATLSVQLSPLPATEQFNQKIDFRTRPAGESLDALVQVLARSVGLSAVTQGIPETVVRYDFGEPKPFREVWDVVLTLNGLEYVLRDNGIVVVGPPASLAGLRPSQKQGAPSMSRTYAVSTNATELQALIESQFPARSGMSVTAFDTLGLISVRGTTAQQARVETILGQFDRSAATPVRRAYTLSYASAEELTEVLTATVTAPEGGENAPSTAQQPTENSAGGAIRQALTDSLTSPEATSGAAPGSNPNAAALLAEGQFSIAADARSNRIIVTAPANVQRDIAALIEELDQPERQVNVQVRIQEVTTDATERLGIDLSAALGNFTTTLFSGDENSGLNFIFDGQRAISGLNLGAVLDAFERQNLARRVDDSNLTVLNNGEATLQSGGVIYITLAGNGSVENVEREIPYGVQLDLSPQITNNNEVVLNISGRVDAVISELTDPSLLNVSTRNLTSQVKLAPGQTVVLGGLLQKELTDTTRQVPVLGDVPIVGNLFSSNSSNEIDTELLVIVTANVLE